jgi:hypothetical protein
MGRTCSAHVRSKRRPRRLWISVRQHRRLTTLAQSHGEAHCVVVRARIILMLGTRIGAAGTADRLGVSDRLVRKWRARWEHAPQLESILEPDRSGRPPSIPVAIRCHVVKIACDRPERETRGKRYRPLLEPCARSDHAHPARRRRRQGIRPAPACRRRAPGAHPGPAVAARAPSPRRRRRGG